MHRSLKFGPFITSIASKPKSHNGPNNSTQTKQEGQVALDRPPDFVK